MKQTPENNIISIAIDVHEFRWSIDSEGKYLKVDCRQQRRTSLPDGGLAADSDKREPIRLSEFENDPEVTADFVAYLTKAAYAGKSFI